MKLTFCGGAKTVTGSNYLIETEKLKVLVDCGLNQGSNYSERQNFEKFPYDPKKINYVLVTHAHIDHIGRLPKLYRDGFRGKIFSTAPTKDFAEILLYDSEHILREEATKFKKSPLYTAADVSETMKLWQKLSYHEKLDLEDLTAEWYDAGHIIGSGSILVKAEGKSVVFSGDLGNFPSPFVKPSETVSHTDYALIESAYGNRVHENAAERKGLLEDLIEETVKAGGVFMIPAFALERTQEMMFELDELVRNGRIPRVPVFIDSPLAIKLTAIYQKYSHDPRYFNQESIALVRGGDAIFDFPGLRLTLTTEQSKEINGVPPPKVIVAGAGMSNGGRILHHERRYLSDPKSTILFVGYQAHGSLGRQILDGAKSVKMFGETIPVNCRVKAIGGYSSHADQPQLLEWIRAMRVNVKKVFVVQGEEEEAVPLAQKIKDELAVESEVPSAGETVVL